MAVGAAAAAWLAASMGAGLSALGACSTGLAEGTGAVAAGTALGCGSASARAGCGAESGTWWACSRRWMVAGSMDSSAASQLASAWTLEEMAGMPIACTQQNVGGVGCNSLCILKPRCNPTQFQKGPVRTLASCMDGCICSRRCPTLQKLVMACTTSSPLMLAGCL